MSTYCTTGRWTPRPDRVDAFVEAWTAFATWASGMPGAGDLYLGRDVGGTGLYLSVGAWESEAAVRAWKSAPEFRRRLAHVVDQVDRLEPSELALVVTVRAGVPVP